MANRLGQEKSPYLLQHSENPVDWYPWCREAFEKAKSEDKPVFLSIGYSTCHWCHVMAHESFEDAEVADRLNRNFVCIKVDREERPDIDAVYMSVCQAMTGSGGWPLTILMTPAQEPFFAGTYFPKRGAYGRYGLMEILEQVTRLWEEDRDVLTHVGNQVVQAIRSDSSSSGHAPDRKLVKQAYTQLQRRFDQTWGGFGPAPKFPTPHNLLFLLRYADAVHCSGALRMAEMTLRAMERGGIHDQIGGGFSRYSTDSMWLVPHFEKMLYDNALLLLAYLTAYQHTGEDRFADVAHRTASYILRELFGKEGGLFCGQDADSDGVEGKYYVFRPEEVKVVLGEQDGAEFCRRYDISEKGNFEGSSIPNRVHSGEAGWKRDDTRLKALYEYRAKRTALHLDDKILLSWNAWAMLALAKGGRILGESAYLDAALQIQTFIEEMMVDGQGRLYLRYRDGEAAYAGQLDDYAVYALALLELYRVTFDAGFLQEAISRAGQMMDLFEDRKNGGYFMTASDAETLITRPKETYDGSIPSGNSAAAMVLQALADLTGEPCWRQAADRQLRFLADVMGDTPSACCFGMLAMMEALYPHRELVCAGEKEIPEEVNAYLKTHPAEDLSILLKTNDNADLLSRCAPFTKDYPIPEQGTVYYLCENGACKAPVSSFELLGL